ncbi:MAG: family 10 glycosylhydrolase [Planctomycetota bacterium]
MHGHGRPNSTIQTCATFEPALYKPACRIRVCSQKLVAFAAALLLATTWLSSGSGFLSAQAFNPDSMVQTAEFQTDAQPLSGFSPDTERAVVATPDTSLQMSPAVYDRNVVAASGVEPIDPGLTEMRLRLTWGGGSSDQWKGTIKVSGGRGTISSLRSLSLATDAPGSIIGAGSQISINQQSPVNFNGVDFTLQASLDAVIEVDLRSVLAPDRHYQAEARVSQLIRSGFSELMDENSNQFSIARAPGDRIQVEPMDDAMVYRPNQLMTIAIRPNLAGQASQAARCRLSIVPARQSAPVSWSGTLDFELNESGSATRQQTAIPVPAVEGVYDLIIELQSDWYRSPVGGSRVNASRRIQFVVISEQPPSVNNDRQWKLITEIASDHFTGNSIGQMIGIGSRTLGNDKFEAVGSGEQSMIQLNPGGWHAIELSSVELYRPHVIEIEYDAGLPSALGLSILQADANGQIPLIGCDSGVVVPDSPVDGDTSARKGYHRIVFWPSTRSPFLLIANRDPDQPVRFGTIRMYAGPARLVSGRNEFADLSDVPLRRFMAFYEAPMFTDSFDARQYKDPLIDQPLDDWLTFYQGADRLIQYLKANSYRGAFITVASEGSSIYPSRLLDASPKYDTGIFLSDGQDPVRKDVLELLMQMFDREGLTLVPTLALSSPLPAVEAMREQDQVNSFDLVDFRQNKRSREQTAVPVYNPLDPLVQRSVTAIVSEIASRYGHHSSFESVAVICRGDTFTQLPGQQWGYDQSTVDRFLQAGNFDEPADLLGTHSAQWLQWRAHQMTLWYADMLASIRQARPDGNLILAPIDLYRGDETSSALSPRIHQGTGFETVMLRMGYEPTLTSNHEGIILLQPERIALNQPLSAERVDVQVRNSAGARQFFQQSGSRGSLFIHRMAWAHFAELQQQAPFNAQQTALLRLQQLTPSGKYNRKRLTESIYESDSALLIDGGIMLSSGQDSSTADILSVFNRLPEAPFQELVLQGEVEGSSPVAVRQTVAGNHWYFYVVNASPWYATVRLALDDQLAAALELFSPSTIRTTESGNFVELEVEPYGLIGGRSPLDGSRQVAGITGYEFDFPGDVVRPLRDHLDRLRRKLVLASSTQALNALENPDFDTGTLDGWQTGDQPSTSIRQESIGGHSGNGSIHLQSDGQTVWLRSNELATPSTGRLSVSAWIRTGSPDVQPPLRISIEGRSSTSEYYRFGTIGAIEDGSDARRVNDQWQRFAVHFDDLPAEGVDRLRIGFDLMGSGDVWIDSVRVYDRWLDENDTRAMTQLLASAGQLLTQPQSLDGGRAILESYWPRFLDEYIEGTPSTRPSQEIAPTVELNASSLEVIPLSAPPERSSRGLPRLRDILPSGTRR